MALHSTAGGETLSERVVLILAALKLTGIPKQEEETPIVPLAPYADPVEVSTSYPQD